MCVHACGYISVNEERCTRPNPPLHIQTSRDILKSSPTKMTAIRLQMWLIVLALFAVAGYVHASSETVDWPHQVSRSGTRSM
jgi:hypothetical protein